MSNLFDQPSLASATNTRVDSACKHIQQCRVSTDDMLYYAGNDVDEVRKNKYRYCIHKDELVLGIGRAWVHNMTRKRTNNAYPRVISSLGQKAHAAEGSKSFIEMLKYMAHYARSVQERKAIVQWFNSGKFHMSSSDGHIIDDPAGHAFTAANFPKLKDDLHWLVDYTPVGYANTVGWAHSDTGDTVLSVMIGGLRTVMNGTMRSSLGTLCSGTGPLRLRALML